jgi:mRNA interferase RelE/StbE
MKIARTDRFKKAWIALNVRERKLGKKAIELMLLDLHYPSLRIKKIQGTQDIYEARVSLHIRLTFKIDNDILVLRNIGKHDDTLVNP